MAKRTGEREGEKGRGKVKRPLKKQNKFILAVTI